MLRSERQTDFLQGLALRHGTGMGILLTGPASREGHLSGPRVTLALGTADETDLKLRAPLSEDHRHRGLTGVRLEDPVIQLDLTGGKADFIER